MLGLGNEPPLLLPPIMLISDSETFSTFLLFLEVLAPPPYLILSAKSDLYDFEPFLTVFSTLGV